MEETKKKGGCLKYGLITFIIISVLGGLMTLFDDEKTIVKDEQKEDTFMANLDSLPDRVINTDSILNVMKRNYTFTKDEFSNNNIMWVKPKAKPKYRNQNGVYCYFCMVDTVPGNFRFVLQYAADDWLFLKDCIFNIDGENWTYQPLKVENDHDSSIWEWFDDAVDVNISMFLYKIGQAKQVKVKLNGQKYYDTYTLQKKEIDAIRKTLEYYEALGGKHPISTDRLPMAKRNI